MKKIALLLALVLVLVLSLTGCSGFQQAAEQYVSEIAAQQEEEEQPRETLPPLTEPMYTDRAALYQYYNLIAVTDTLESLTAQYGEPVEETTENGTNYTWVMEDGYGFSCAFYDDGSLRAKILYYDDLRQLGALSRATGISNVTMLSGSYTLDMVKSLMGGRAMQIMANVKTQGTTPEIEYLYCWISEDGTQLAQIYFDSGFKVKQVVYNLGEDETPEAQ